MGIGTADEHQREVVVGGDGGHAPIAPQDGRELVHAQAAPVRVERVLEHRLGVVLLGTDAPGHHRVPAVGADDDSCSLDRRRLAIDVAADADDDAGVLQDLLDDVVLPDLDARPRGGVDEDRVEHGCVAARRRSSIHLQRG